MLILQNATERKMYMLTLEEIENVSFRKSGLGGYKTEDVDNFVDGVIYRVRELQTANKELEARIEQLNKKVVKYEEKAESVQDAIITAEVLSKKLIREAQEKADAITAEAEKSSAEKIKEADEYAEKTIRDADEKAEKVLLESGTKAETILNNVLSKSAEKVDENNRTIEAQKIQIKRIQKEVTKFREELIAAYKSHIKLINTLPKEDEFLTYQKKMEESYPVSVANSAATVGEEVKKEADDAAKAAYNEMLEKRAAEQPKKAVQPEAAEEDTEQEKNEEQSNAAAESGQTHILGIGEVKKPEGLVYGEVSADEETDNDADDTEEVKSISDYNSGDVVSAKSVSKLIMELKAEKKKSSVKDADSTKEKPAAAQEASEIFSSEKAETDYKKSNVRTPVGSNNKFNVLKLDEADEEEE